MLFPSRSIIPIILFFKLSPVWSSRANFRYFETRQSVTSDQRKLCFNETIYDYGSSTLPTVNHRFHPTARYGGSLGVSV